MSSSNPTSRGCFVKPHPQNRARLTNHHPAIHLGGVLHVSHKIEKHVVNQEPLGDAHKTPSRTMMQCVYGRVLKHPSQELFGGGEFAI